ncbi:MAG TPA: NAD(P)-dependent oxidoreductase [Dongiaceae bacterium]|nr:NAD(P)-dependent oxidoreductase [Dongiaceae bacterium]
MTVALLGARGLIGRAIEQGLEQAGRQVRSIGRQAGLTHRLDIATGEGLSTAAFAGCSVLIHAAGVTDEEMRRDRRAAFERAAVGTEAVLQAALAAGIRKLAYISSAHVYGPLAGEIDEDSPVNPLSDYALAHYLVEQLFRRHVGQAGIDCLILRPCAVYGPLGLLSDFHRWDLVPFGFPAAIIRDGRIEMKSSGEQRRNFVGSDVIAQTIMDWLGQGSQAVQVVNPLGAADMSVLDLAERCAEIGQSITGRACHVVRAPDGGVAPTLPFIYRSRFATPRAILTLDQHLRDLMGRLINEE